MILIYIIYLYKSGARNQTSVYKYWIRLFVDDRDYVVVYVKRDEYIKKIKITIVFPCLPLPRMSFTVHRSHRKQIDCRFLFFRVKKKKNPSKQTRTLPSFVAQRFSSREDLCVRTRWTAEGKTITARSMVVGHGRWPKTGFRTYKL